MKVMDGLVQRDDEAIVVINFWSDVLYRDPWLRLELGHGFPKIIDLVGIVAEIWGVLRDKFVNMLHGRC